METVNVNYINNLKKLFQYYKTLGDKAFNQVKGEDIHWHFNEESNSIAVIVKHIAGNSISRWTDFFYSDGEKEWRDRDSEFEDTFTDKATMIAYWEKGWDCFFDVLNSLKEGDLMRVVYIRNEGHTVVEALNRHLAHSSMHIGQIVFIAKMLAGPNWQTPTIPKGQSKAFNSDKFSAEKERKFFK